MSVSKNSRMLQFVNCRMRVTLDDGRTLVGRFMAFDTHMNLVLAETEEFRKVKSKAKVAGAGTALSSGEEKRALGFVLLRGECVVSLTVVSPPPLKKPGSSGPLGGRGMIPPGALAPGRGVPTSAMVPVGSAPLGLSSAPVRGIGGPAPFTPGMMVPPPGYGSTAGLGMPTAPGGIPGSYGRGGVFPPPGYGRGVPPGGGRGI
uniref:Sm protein B n=1 Tax=Compsopogon caeruleus TaxID=31354 RepID=A0A6T6C345_9RHOD|mmetsp:Transcript_2413/g.4167  ORF Transcript_2413/g.4167 Transcript_2413/m.4167 type:complete len:203 (+) Transcript_2413:232-840(+)|eukprot:CAMPEP_0184679522 /NCGR_PEP_ID=MMETSP0312-20130426/2355_1 /TAXON_ID=31354 /ORGANISM="Compsopogon coeruleus, Strain SAG 36.94" /LENGTH=202 /DNA_ID=CAMNT_0027129015 /DNA_START=155 /DNA_END=763 /DNA_ORIENTATION=+